MCTKPLGKVLQRLRHLSASVRANCHDFLLWYAALRFEYSRWLSGSHVMATVYMPTASSMRCALKCALPA